MIYIHFIVNPIAGSGHNYFSQSFLQNYFEVDKYDIRIKSSAYKGNAIVLTQESISQQASIIVACGGDGTINEVASTLVDTTIPLGIIPLGSGNGLASSLKIPKKIENAIHVIKNNKRIKIDVGCVNEKYFFSNTGFGFDTSVIENYEVFQKRTLLGYLEASFKSFCEFHKREACVITINETLAFANPFLIFISNSNEMGYKVSLTPKASLHDGLLDVVLVPRMNKLDIMLFGFYMLVKKPQLHKAVKCFQTKTIKLSRQQGFFFKSQIDGELTTHKGQTLSIFLKEKALIVIK